MPCHHMQHARNMGPILFTCNENIAHVMPHVTACAVMSCGIAQRVHTGKPATLIIRGAPGITYKHAVRTGQMIFMKNNHFIF